MKIFLTALLLSCVAYAHEEATYRPPSFSYQTGKAVFVDIQEAIYNINYDINLSSAEVTAQFKMSLPEAGFPIFDSIEEPTSITVDGSEATASLVKTTDGATRVRVINQSLPAGTYSVQVKVPLKNLVEYTKLGVKSAFWVTDLEDRYYLERYIPSNLEYDNIKMIFNIQFKGLKTQQHIFANGAVKWIDEENVQIEYPDYFTVNSLYFHTTPKDTVELITTDFKSVDGRDIPVAIYMSKGMSAAGTLADLQKLALKVFNELEGDYGAFPHSSITIYNANLSSMGLGGMEYAGATVTNKGALAHELFHSYFARGVTPANGNAGWIDESLASWRDNGYNRLTSLGGSSSMAAHGTYVRKTDTAAYSFGARFMAFLDNKFAQKGGLKPFMNKLLENKLFSPLTTEEFIAEMTAFYEEEVQALFNKYVFNTHKEEMTKMKDHVHRKLSGKELQEIL